MSAYTYVPKKSHQDPLINLVLKTAVAQTCMREIKAALDTYDREVAPVPVDVVIHFGKAEASLHSFSQRIGKLVEALPKQDDLWEYKA